MRRMFYCKKCLLPSTKPGLTFDENGVCSACTNYENRVEIDWDAQEKKLVGIFEQYKDKTGANWDCIVPVSGGKDSTYQVLTVLKYGLKPLCVTATTCHLSEIGRRNIENLKNLGVDYIEFSINPKVRRKLNAIGLRDFGDISLPEHMSIFSIPMRIACKFGIKLLVWGENSANEFGGDEKDSQNEELDSALLEKLNIFAGLSRKKLVQEYGFTQSEILAFTPPTEEEIRTVGIKEICLGQFIPWDGYSNALIAQAYGLETLGRRVESTIVDYENLDNYQTGIHDYFKFLKFGFGRGTDIASLHIRRERMTRNLALDLVKKYDGNFPWTYLEMPLEKILEPLEISVEEFIEICDKFTNKDLFETDDTGKLVKDSQGNLRKKKDDNME